VVLGALVLVIACGACGSARSNPAPLLHVIVVTGSSPTNAKATVGDLVEIKLTSSSYGRDGHVVPWSTPVSSDQAILAPTRPPTGVACPARSTCTFFAAHRWGDTTITAIKPSGILCNRQGTACVGVLAAMRRIEVHISPR